MRRATQISPCGQRATACGQQGDLKMRFALAGLGLIALGAAAPANAADIRLPVKGVPPAYVQAYYNWTGFYVGAHVGYGWADFSGTDALLGVVGGGTTADGMIYGGQVG